MLESKITIKITITITITIKIKSWTRAMNSTDVAAGIVNRTKRGYQREHAMSGPVFGGDSHLIVSATLSSVFVLHFIECGRFSTKAADKVPKPEG